ncbi:MAG: hypothetical protein RR639_04230 [Hydrogenoanaerobacterium sp.]
MPLVQVDPLYGGALGLLLTENATPAVFVGGQQGAGFAKLHSRSGGGAGNGETSMCEVKSGDKLLYHCREVTLLQHGDEYLVHSGDSGKAISFTNPLEAWSCFIVTLDCHVRRRIGDMLEHEGKNRYTGEEK